MFVLVGLSVCEQDDLLKNLWRNFREIFGTICLGQARLLVIWNVLCESVQSVNQFTRY